MGDTVTLLPFENTVSLTTERCRWEQGLSSSPQVWVFWGWPASPPALRRDWDRTSLLDVILLKIKQHLPPPCGPLQRASGYWNDLVLLSPTAYQRAPNHISLATNRLAAKELCLQEYASLWLAVSLACVALLKCYEGADNSVPCNADGFNTA